MTDELSESRIINRGAVDQMALEWLRAEARADPSKARATAQCIMKRLDQIVRE
jgi:hypothetical protein